ncbi:plant cysteine oxidase 2 isoform X1 [Elaeis guineensis]|uniref:plant cysteine oxidase 2 isoform X1 n=1 Tax=Elaeis guineensis var. tenera TaxID=51953 RepID=UPI003C6D4D1D
MVEMSGRSLVSVLLVFFLSLLVPSEAEPVDPRSHELRSFGVGDPRKAAASRRGDKMRPEDVGLSSDLLFFKSRNAVNRAPRITYSTVYKCNNFSMCIFFLPPTAVIPLHNHPGMTVFSKLLVGSMHIKSYDWVDPVIISTDSKPSSQLRLAKLVVDSEFTAPCNTCILYPTSGGNMHTFRAMTPCAVLDVLGPPYSKEDDRDCTYYHDHPYSSFSDYDSAQQGKYDHLRWLEEIDIPKNLKMDGVEYLGPQILDD